MLEGSNKEKCTFHKLAFVLCLCSHVKTDSVACRSTFSKNYVDEVVMLDSWNEAFVLICCCKDLFSFP